MPKESVNEVVSKRTTSYLCPICHVALDACDGGKLTTVGVTMWCPSDECEAQEVFAHESNEKNAFEIITSKYKPIK
jgi:hypothetical protein